MSQIMEKTLASLPKLLSQSLIGGGNSKPQPRQPPPMDVQHFMKQVHKAKSKTQEAAIVKSHLSVVKQKLKDIDATSSQSFVRGCFTKIIFSYQLGHDVSAMAIEAIKLANQGRGFDKRLGYLTSCLLLQSKHELTILMTGTLLKDLKSTSMTDNCLALKVAGELMDVETIPYVLPEVVKKLSHQQDLVKEKALQCFRSLYQKAPELLEPDISRLNGLLSSRDPGVLTAVMNIFLVLTSQKPSQFVGLSTSFMHILHQINSRGFGSVYYHSMVALPWLQICLLKILCNLAQVDANLSAHLEPVLKVLIEKTKVSIPISLAIMVESIQTATKICASDSLLQLCSRCIMRLMASDSSGDMRYQGLGLLISLSKVKPSYASQHQAAVMDCLSSDDPAIQSRTTFLLHAMANSANVKVICVKLFEQYGKSSDHDFQKEILEMVMNLVEKMASDIEWYVMTNFQVLSHDSSFKDRIANSVMIKLEQFYEHNEMLDLGGLTNILEHTLSYLENETQLNPDYVVRIQLLGVLAPLVQNQLQADRFFNIVTPCVFKVSEHETGIKCNQVMLNLPGQFSNDQKEGSSSSGEIYTRVKCVETIIKLVLAQCLDSHSVLQWLQKNDYKGRSLNTFLYGVLHDLEDLVSDPSSLSVKSQIMFHSQISDLDLSLSFIDSLVVQDLLNTGNCYLPKYVKEIERLKFDITASPSPMSIHENKFDENMPSLPSLARSLSTEREKFTASMRVKGRWRDQDNGNECDVSEDDDDGSEQFLFFDAGSSVKTETEKDKKELAEKLFAGLSSSSAETSFSLSDSGISSSKGPMKSPRNFWDDDDNSASVVQSNNNERKSSFFGMDLHPFGISKRVSPKPDIWRDTDHTDTMNTNTYATGLVPENTSLFGQSGGTMRYDAEDAPSYTPPYRRAVMDSNDGLEMQDELSVEQETGLSIYSEFADRQSPAVMSPDIAVSTVDTLTDSDPEGT